MKGDLVMDTNYVLCPDTVRIGAHAVTFDAFDTRNERFAGAVALARKAASTDYALLIVGETGVGKGLLAQAIHHASGRSAGPFVEASLGALDPRTAASEVFGHEAGAFPGAIERRAGVFREAGEGTLVLDELPEMPMPLQGRLLRTLERRAIVPLGGVEEPARARIIVTTRHPLAALRVDRTMLREDLFGRVSQLVIEVPSLRDRPEDVEPLFRRHADLARARAEKGPFAWEGDVVERLRAHRWPGNVREVRSVARRAATFMEGDRLTGEDVDRLIAEGGSREAREARDDGARIRSFEALSRCRGDVREAARVVDLALSALYHKLSTHGWRP